MYDKYLKVGAVEILNIARTAAYIGAHLPQIEVKCSDPELGGALGHSAYTSPEQDAAPWTRSGRAAAARFYGLFPKRIDGADDSTRTVDTTELSGDGAIMTAPRYGSREMRVVATAFAADEEAMNEGLAWLRDALAVGGCSDADFGCTGTEVTMFAALPVDRVAAHDLTRTFFRVDVTEAPRVTRRLNSKAGALWEIEFLLTAGIAWAFTLPTHAGTLALDTGTNHQDPAGQDCSGTADAYDNFVNDPFFTGITRPPRPPAILPPNILDITSWRRKTLALPAAQTRRWGRVAPVVSVLTEDAVQYVRLRFYRQGAGLTGCGYDAEVIVSYLPAGAVLTLDARTREATVRLSNGRVAPAGNLLFGSDGKPFIWPSLGCQHTYTLTADIMPGQSGVAVVLETAVRE